MTTATQMFLALGFFVLSALPSNGEESVPPTTKDAVPSLSALQIDIARGVVTEDSELLRSCLTQLDAWIESHPEDAVTALANGGSVCERLPDEAGCVDRLAKLCQLPLTDRKQTDLRQEFIRKAFNRLKDAKRKEWIKAIVDRTLEQPAPYGDLTLVYVLREAWMANGAYPARWALVDRITQHIQPALDDASLSSEFRDYLRQQFREFEWLALQTHYDGTELKPLWESVRQYLEQYGTDDPHSIEALTKGLKATCHCKKNKLMIHPAVLPSDEWLSKWRGEFTALPVSAVDRRQSFLADAWTEWDSLMVEHRYKTGWLTVEDLRTDLRLQGRITGEFKNPSIGDLLKWMSEGSSVRIEAADNTTLSWQAAGAMRPENVPVWSIMEYLAISPTLHGRWFAEPDRLVLHVSAPPSIDAKPPVSWVSQWRWGLLGINLAVISVILWAVIRRRRTDQHTSATPADH